MATPLPSYVLPKCHPECEAAISCQISLEIYASSVYDSMSSNFNSHTVGLEHLVQIFRQQAIRETEHARSLLQLHTQRRGRLHLPPVLSPEPSCWNSLIPALECALCLNMSVNFSLFHLQRLAIEKKDAALCDWLEGPCWAERVKFITELSDHISRLHQMGALQCGLAEDLSATLILGDSGKNGAGTATLRGWG